MAYEGFTMPPPSSGLDLVSPVDNMEPSAALELINIFPGAGAPTVRLGYQQFNSSGDSIPSTQIHFMHEYPLPNGTSLLIVATRYKLFAINENGVVTEITKSGGYLGGDWNKELFGQRIYLANSNGDVPQVYNGTGTAVDITASSGPSGGLGDLVNVASYRERLYFVERNSMKMWYHKSVRQLFITGTPALDSYDFQFIMRRGGYLLFTGSYTNLKNVTAQDLFMAVSSEGEIVMYSGYSPDDPDWTLVAHFIIGKPLGPKAFVRVNNDIWIITQQGIVPVSALFELDPQQALNVVSLRINPLISQYATVTPFSEMWNGFFWPAGRRVYIQIPEANNAASFLVYAIDTKSWSQFSLNTNQHSVASGKFLNLPFYASATGIVYKGETGYVDAVNLSGVGESISFSGRTAFSFYGSRGNYKAFKDIRPLLRARRGVTLNLGLDTDFRRLSYSANSSIVSVAQNTTFTAWSINGTVSGNPGFVPWGSPWSGDLEYIFDRFAIKGQGHSASVKFSGSIKNTALQILGFEIRYDIGGQV